MPAENKASQPLKADSAVTSPAASKPKPVSYWSPDCCPECGSADVELFSFKENEHEYTRGTCRNCGHAWQSIRNDWGC